MLHPLGRGLCLRCLHPPLTCYCGEIRPFDPKIRFVILIHGREAQKKIATGRLAHLCLERSELIPGYDYSDHPRVNEILADPSLHPVVLYPGEGSLPLNKISDLEKKQMFPAEKELVIFVIDGTWITARKTMQRSENLARLPRVSFDLRRQSRFRVRRQPDEHCLSTAEAIHETLELLGGGRGLNLSARPHDNLLHVFDHMVDQQIVLSSVPKLYCQWSPRKRPKNAASQREACVEKKTFP